MADFTPEQKRFVVEQWACYFTSTEIATAFVIMFSDDELPAERPSTSQLAKYNPDFATGQSLGTELKSFFDERRKQFLENTESIPIANKAYRLRELGGLYEKQKNRSPVIAAKLLEQAAKESGGMFDASARAAPGSGAISGGTSGAGTSDPERAEELNTVLDSLRTRPTGETTPQGVSGYDAQPGTTGEHQSPVRE